MKVTNIMVILVGLPAICLGYLPADFDYDGTVDFNDFATFSSQWLEENSEMNYGSGGDATCFVASYDAPVHVKSRADYVCDGVDDHIEIQAAIDKIGQESPTWGGVVVLSSGKFNLSAPIRLNCTSGDGTYISLWGLGNGIIGTYLEWAAGTYCDGIYYRSKSGCVGDFSLRRLRLRNRNDGNYWVVRITCEGDTNIYDCLFEDVFVIGGGDSGDHSHGGMYIQKDWATHFVRCTFEESRGVGLQIGRMVGGMFTDCFFAGNQSHGLKIGSGANVNMVNCASQSNGAGTQTYSAYGMYINSDYSVLTNIYLCQNSGWGIYLGGPWSALTNCLAYDNGQGLDGIDWASGGIYIGETNITAVNCQARKNDTGTNCFGFYVNASGANLIGCRSLENSRGLYVAQNKKDVYLDVRFEDNLIDNYFQGDGTAHSMFAHRNHKTTVSGISCEVDCVDNGTIYISDTTNNDVTFSLPGAMVGLEFEFFFSNGVNQLRIDPYGAEEIYENNSSHGTGKYIYADEVGESVKLKCIYPGRWEMVDKIGTWAAEP